MGNDRVKRINKTFFADQFMVVTACGFVVYCHLRYCSHDMHEYNYHSNNVMM